jgi:cell division protein ZapB
MRPGPACADRRAFCAHASAAIVVSVDADLDTLEQKIASLIAHARDLRDANEALRRDLSSVQEQNRALSQRMQQASTRLDALLDRLPEG